MSSHTPSSRAQSPNSDGFITPIRQSDTDTTPSPSKWSSPPVSPGLLTSKLALLEAANALSAAAETLAAASQAMSSAAKSLATASGSVAYGSREQAYESTHQEYERADYSRSPSEFEWQAPSYSLCATESQQDVAAEFAPPIHFGADVETPAQAISSVPGESIQPPVVEETSHSTPSSYPGPQSIPDASSISQEQHSYEDVSLDAFAQSINNDHAWGAPSDKPAASIATPRSVQEFVPSAPGAKPAAAPTTSVAERTVRFEPSIGVQNSVQSPVSQDRPGTSANTHTYPNTSSDTRRNSKEYIVLKSEFDVIPLICHLTSQVTSGNVVCFVKSLPVVEPLMRSGVSKSVLVNASVPTAPKKSIVALQSEAGCLMFQSAYSKMPTNFPKNSINLMIHVGWTGDEAMYNMHVASASAGSNIIILIEGEAPKGATIFSALHKLGVQAISVAESNSLNNQTGYARLALYRDQWKSQLRSDQALKYTRQSYMAWITHHHTGRYKVPNWSATVVVAQANRFVQEVLLRGKSGDVVGALPGVSAGFAKMMKLEEAVQAGTLIVADKPHFPKASR